ncbi:MAG: ferritin-like domain-containing protein [Candidatus Pelagadaptatus aseana]|uniref:ferritin-like domain-containing protein n=1 Tax=Candidatus Pelagadaptatus aseana TaxID=3120508 RepID=UPI0039B20F6D
MQEDRILQLYKLGKELNWNADTDLDWDKPIGLADRDVRIFISGFSEYQPFLSMSTEEQDRFLAHMDAWTDSQFLHGEQGALLVASQLVSCAPTYNAKLYAASQTFDEARHVETFNRYLQKKAGIIYPIDGALKDIIDKILSDERWDLKFIGMQVVIEGLALAAFTTSKEYAQEGGFKKDMLELIIRDEARHVAFGIHYLSEYVKMLSDEEKEARAEFAYQACLVSRERLVPTDVFRNFGWDIEEARQVFLDGGALEHFRKLLFQRVIPNLRRIGLLTERIRPKFEALGILEYEDMPDDGDIDWAELSKPLYG